MRGGGSSQLSNCIQEATRTIRLPYDDAEPGGMCQSLRVVRCCKEYATSDAPFVQQPLGQKYPVTVRKVDVENSMLKYAAMSQRTSYGKFSRDAMAASAQHHCNQRRHGWIILDY